MNIAIIGWGSLIWNPDTLLISGEWSKDGPTLPLEFCRISSFDTQNERVTLVISKKHGMLCNTSWCLSRFDIFSKAKANLALREGNLRGDKIHFLIKENDNFIESEMCTEDVRIADQVKLWLSSKPELDAAIWTGFESNWLAKRDTAFSIPNLKLYLQEKSKKETWPKISEYFLSAPLAIQTPGRECFEEILKQFKSQEGLQDENK